MLRTPTRIIGLALLAAGIAACDQAGPTETETVRLALVDAAQHGGMPFRTAMTQELTTTVTGDPDGSGYALITINIGKQEVCWQMSASNIRLPATSAHIHTAASGISGPIVVALSAPHANGSATACRADVDRDRLRDILLNPTNYYVNVHTVEFPAGAIRGQLGE